MWVNPCVGRISSVFGPRWGRHHDGTDVAAETGTAIWAASAGTVTMASHHSTGGNMTKVDHGGGVITWYLHQSAMFVSVGQRVAAGQHIGNVGNTGNSTGPHLHFEVHVNGPAVDPQPFLKARGITLGTGVPTITPPEEDIMASAAELRQIVREEIANVVSPVSTAVTTQVLNAKLGRSEVTVGQALQTEIAREVVGSLAPIIQDIARSLEGPAEGGSGTGA